MRISDWSSDVCSSDLRLRDHMDDFQQAFNDADIVLALPVYAAGEAPIDGIFSDSLVAGLRDRGHRQANVVADADALASALARTGAGRVGKEWGRTGRVRRWHTHEKKKIKTTTRYREKKN